MHVGDEAARLIDCIIGDAGDSRAYRMAKMYARGDTLQEIGEEYDLTRERVRQLINNETPWNTSDIGQARRVEAANKLKAEKASVQAWSQANPGAPISDAARLLGLTEDQIRTFLGRRKARHEEPEERTWQVRRSEDELLDDLRRFHAETGKTTAVAYEVWAKTESVPGPQTMMHRFGSWNSATTAAGIKKARPIERGRLHSDEDLWAAVIEGLKADLFTAREFEKWLPQIPGAPSFATIRQRLGLLWGEMRAEGQRILAGESDRDPDWIEDVFRERDWAAFLEEEDPMIHMRAARLALGTNITVVRYAEWATANKRPAYVTLLRRTRMRWAELVESVGGVTVNKQARIPDDELLAWMRAFLGSEPSGTYAAYVRWRGPLGAPSVETIMQRFGGWEAARTLAQRSE